ncbi:MAG: molybdenum cofactor biosynthesis protein B [Pseudomonadales bacterium]|nr:molybdenum cofactor biosynthesis protein B [Pseudomonadales bacterium]
MMGKKASEFVALNMAVVTVSDTRDEGSDTSGQYLADALQEGGHNLVARAIVKDDVFALRALVSYYISDPLVQVVLVTGGTGFTERDNTPQALIPLMERQVDGFGELFRHISYQEIGTSTVQSRAVAGISNYTAIFCMPGSTGACKTAWKGILSEQLDARHRPCNFIGQVVRPVDSSSSLGGIQIISGPGFSS